MPMIRIDSIGTWQCLVVLGYLLLSGLQPHDRFTWVLEVSWVAVGLVIVTRLSLRGTSITPLLAWLLTLHALILIYGGWHTYCLLYTSPSPRDKRQSRMPSSA